MSLLALALTDFVSARVCDLTNSSIFNRFLSLPEMDQFEQMLACELDRLLDLKGAGIFMAWKMDLRRDSMIKTICKMDIVETHELHTVLENMLKASHHKSVQSARYVLQSHFHRQSIWEYWTVLLQKLNYNL